MSGKPAWRVSERERAVIELVARGLTNRDIAAALETTEYVVKNYLRNIYDKLGLWNRVELALWFEARTQEDGAFSELLAGAPGVERAAG